jgi:pimeloyl-ACP methyl ester carboxylesterase
MTSCLVLHDVGDARGGQPWRDAFAATTCGKVGRVEAPDLPGHGSASPSRDGAYEMVDAAWFSLSVLRAWPGEKPIVVGVGVNGWAGTILALGGRASGLVLVDGLGGPWCSPSDWVAAQRAWTRAVAADRAAVEPWTRGGAGGEEDLDPRLRHGLAPMSSKRMAEDAMRALGGLGLPLLAVVSDRSAISREEAEALVAPVDDASVVAIGERDAAVVVPLIIEWGNVTGDR